MGAKATYPLPHSLETRHDADCKLTICGGCAAALSPFELVPQSTLVDNVFLIRIDDGDDDVVMTTGQKVGGKREITSIST